MDDPGAFLVAYDGAMIVTLSPDRLAEFKRLEKRGLLKREGWPWAVVRRGPESAYIADAEPYRRRMAAALSALPKETFYNAACDYFECPDGRMVTLADVPTD